MEVKPLKKIKKRKEKKVIWIKKDFEVALRISLEKKQKEIHRNIQLLYLK
jgi:hypothetical protein